MTGLGRRRVANIIWILLEKAGHVAIAIVTFLAYGLFLTPEQLGIAVIILAIVELCTVFICSLFDNSLIRESHLTDTQAGSAFWASIFLGSLFGVVLCAVFIQMLALQDLHFVIISVVLYIPLQTCVRVHIVELRRKNEFKKLTVRTVIAKLLGGVVGITLAWLSFGPTALIAQQLVGAFVASTIILCVERRPLPFALDIPFLNKTFIVGLPSALKSMLQNLLNRAGVVILGSSSGAVSAGFYSFGQKLTQLPKDAVDTAIVTYGHSVFSKRHTDTERLASLYKDITSLALVFLLPSFLGFAAVADNLITSIYGEKWNNSIYIVQGLAINAAIGFIFAFLPSLLIATANNTRLLVADACIVTAVLVMCLLFSSQYGEVILLIGVITRTLLLLPLQIRLLIELTGKSFVALYSVCLPQLASALTMFFVVSFAGQFIHLKPSIEVLVQIVIGILVYFSMLFLLWPKVISDCKKIMAAQ